MRCAVYSPAQGCPCHHPPFMLGPTFLLHFVMASTSQAIEWVQQALKLAKQLGNDKAPSAAPYASRIPLPIIYIFYVP